MNGKPPIWKDGVLWVWSEYLKSYIANYCPSHYWDIGMSIGEWKEMRGLDG